MDSTQFFAASRAVIVAGKGGVGKTTITAALATVAAREGMKVLAVATDGTGALARALDMAPMTGDEARDYTTSTMRAGEIRLLDFSAQETLEAYLHDHGLSKISDRMARTGMLDLIATATPGVTELLTLGGIRQLEAGPADLVVVDGPAAGHAINLLRAPATMRDLAEKGRLREQADHTLEWLADARRCRVMLVALAEATPVNETVETAFALEEDIGVALGPVVVNRLASPSPPPVPATSTLVAERRHLVPAAEALDEAVRYLHFRARVQGLEVERLGEELPLPQLRIHEAVDDPITRPVSVELATAIGRLP